jgi:hypothetical protein
MKGAPLHDVANTPASLVVKTLASGFDVLGVLFAFVFVVAAKYQRVQLQQPGGIVQRQQVFTFQYNAIQEGVPRHHVLHHLVAQLIPLALQKRVDAG